MSITSDQDPPRSAAVPDTPPAPAPARSRTGVWALVLRLHFYAGVFVAPFLVLAALTGLAYAFTPQLDQLVYGQELRVEQVTGQPRPLAEQIRAARTAHPEGSIATVVLPAGPERTTAVVLSVPELGEKQRTVYVDPYTAQVRGELTTWFGSTPLTTWLDEMHRGLHLGATGRLYSEMAASWLWVIVGGGLLLWLGRRRRYLGKASSWRVLWPRRGEKGVRRTRARHAALGLWLATGLLFLSTTGLTWSDHAGKRFDSLQQNLNSSAPALNTALPGNPASAAGGHGGHGAAGGAEHGDPAGEADRVLATARSAGLSGPVELAPPKDAHSTWSVTQADNRWPVHKDQVAVDPATGQVTARVDWADHPPLAKLSSLGIQAHMGLLFGLPNQLLLAAIACGLLTAVFLGYRMWWQRRPTRADRRAPFGRPPARGAWRSVPLPLLLVGAPVVLLVAWALPVLGFSLLAFLVIDLALGALRRRRTTPA
ncbi:PepSY domain-containing protein [Actinomadura craniellae]|uniref:PepSY domain-containing protein n=1 Tax=Actinomadura craniellae TaxID=2231787 RepID=A0A365HDU8_9ACTN|nr:PepSY domain-containing protein [Actinomadura craniellae]RAY17096.1 PepSY domain-containing protein [Actinomadura craniellae]